MAIEKTITAYGLTTRVWTCHPTYGYGCAECCNGDRCDENCTAVYKGRRKECPHCKGRGWIPKEDVETTDNLKSRTFSKSEALKALAQGEKITHVYFTKEEFIYQDGMNYIDEMGCVLNPDLFWQDRNNDLFETGWSLYNSP